MYDARSLPASKSSRTTSAGVVNISGHQVLFLQETQFRRMTSSETACIGLGGVPGSGGGPDVVSVDKSVLDDPELLFAINAGWTTDGSTVKLELQD